MGLSERNRVKVRICNQDYIFLSPAEPEHLEFLAAFVEAHMQGILDKEPRLSAMRAAVMAAVIFADGMLGLKDEHKRLLAQLEGLQFRNSELESSLQKMKADQTRRAKGKGRHQ